MVHPPKPGADAPYKTILFIHHQFIEYRSFILYVASASNSGLTTPVTILIYNHCMPEYRRFRVEGGIYFFTVVTYHRNPVFVSPIARRILHAAWVKTNLRFPFETLAVCLLPDHLHCLWRLPEGDANYSIRWRVLKNLFTVRYLKEVGYEEDRNESRQKRHEAAVWQRRFWEHTILDEDDFEEHLDYIHINPVKHGLARRPADWKWSSFRRYVKEGLYESDWEGGEAGRVLGYQFD